MHNSHLIRTARLILPEIERAELDLSQDSSQMLETIRIGIEDDRRPPESLTTLGAALQRESRANVTDL